MENNITMNATGNNSTEQMIRTMKMFQHIQPSVAWILLAIKLCFMILIIVGNSLVLAVFCRSSKIRSVPYNMFIFALAAIDLLTGVIVLPGDIYKNVVPNLMDPDDPIPSHFTNKTLCLAGMFTINQVLTWSSTTLMVIAADRLIATIWPLRYHHIVTRARALLMLILFCVMTSLPMYVATAHAHFVTYNPKMPCVMPYQYHPILTKTAVVFWGSAQLAVSFILYALIGLAVYSGRTQVNNQKRVTVMMAVVLIVFTICSLPIMMINLIKTDHSSPQDKMIIAYIFFGLVHASSFANPIIYNVTSQAFRKEFKDMCGCAKSPRRHHGSEDERTAYDFRSTA